MSLARGLLGLSLLIGLGIAALGSITPSSRAAFSSMATARCLTYVDSLGASSPKRVIADPACQVVDRLARTVGGPMIDPAQAAAVPSTTSAVYPLQVSANGRYLVDQNNTPFLMVGDSPQALIGGVSERDADLYLANRQAAGINTVWVNLLCNDYTGCRSDGATFDGIAPFTQTGDLSTPNEQYFARVDRVLNAAGQYGMAVVLDPIETGGWLPVLRANGVDKAYAYGQYLGRRYRDTPNIIWMSGNDFQTWHDAADDELVLAVARGIRDADPVHLQSVELDYYVSSSQDDQRWAPFIQLNAVYTYQPTYAELLKAYNQDTRMPTFMVEANYELEHDYTGPATLRRQEYWAMLSGAAGQLYGNRYTWQFIGGWKDHLDTIGSLQLAYMARFFSAYPWYDLVPDQDHAFVVDGYGTPSSGSVNDSDYVTAALTPDGTLGIAYVPSQPSIDVNVRPFGGQILARWYDPSADTYVAASSAPSSTDGQSIRRFQIPGRNSNGDTDWVLVVERA